MHLGTSRKVGERIISAVRYVHVNCEQADLIPAACNLNYTLTNKAEILMPLSLHVLSRVMYPVHVTFRDGPFTFIFLFGGGGEGVGYSFFT